jgi:RND family efflux transporter MFP subunit
VAEPITTTWKPPAPPSAAGRPAATRGRLWAVLGLVLAASLGAAWWFVARGLTATARSGPVRATGAPAPTATALRVEVVKPEPGGLGRQVVQPGIVHAFDKADLYAKVSGYLVRQKVDIGDAVKKGDVLAEVDAPEFFRSRDQARAALGQARAKVRLSEARVLTAEADRVSAAAVVTQAQADIAKLTAARAFRQKERDRIAELVRREAVEPRLLDEQQDQLDSAVGAERAGEAAVATAKAGVAATTARVAQAQAELEQSRADVATAEADLAKAEVYVDYTRITSPYTGVVTRRSFHDGDFIRSAAEGGTIPVLSVARTNLMRVVIMVPDLDVPFVRRGDPATIVCDALAGQVFRGEVARFSNSETELKLMRTEVDLPNPDNRLRDGMYGTATLEVARPSKNLTVPSTALIEQTDKGEGAVYLVRGGKVHRQPVRVGADNGSRAEILAGLAPDDQVIVRYNGSIAEGIAASPSSRETR